MKPIRRLAVLLAASLVSAAFAEAPIRAYRDINFGDSAAVVAQKVFDDTSIRTPLEAYTADSRTLGRFTQQIADRNAFYVDIGGIKYDVTFVFNDNKLYRIRFISALESASYFDTRVKQSRDNLVDVITRAHGRPTTTTNLSFFDMQAGYIKWSHVWRTNSEGVAYKIGIGEGGYEYYASLWIEWSWMVDFIAQAEQDLKNNQQRDDAGDF